MTIRRNRGTAVVARNKRAETDRLTSQLILNYFEGLNCPRSLTCALLYKYKEYDQLQNLEIDPHQYNDPELFRNEYLATHYLAKFNGFPSSAKSRVTRAIDKFLQMEQLCTETNRRLRDDSLVFGPVGERLLAARSKISSVLGQFDPVEWVDSSCWGPGVSLSVKGGKRSWADKFQNDTDLSRDFFMFAKDCVLPYFPRCGWREELLTFKNMNEILTVPKNSKIDRVIAVEPGINLFFQKGIGSMIRRRLGNAGIDLKHGQARHMKLASLAAIEGNVSTIDFSSASDTISKRLVEFLLPREWYLVLDALRSKGGLINDRYYHWEKFSSMGNGFTFELESLIFYALATTCVKNVDRNLVSVYGDDVILPTYASESFSELSEFCGFKFNRSKSYTTSYFRESCGAHWFDYSYCTPVYLKTKVASHQEAIRHLNRLWTYRDLPGVFVTWRWLLATIPPYLRLYGPTQLGDAVIHNDASRWKKIKVKHGKTWDGLFVMGYAQIEKQRCEEFEGVFTSKLFGLQGRQQLTSTNKYPSHFDVLEDPPSDGNNLPTGRSFVRTQAFFIPRSILANYTEFIV